jgi:DNA-binding transcriptional ArsR family regulator
MQGEIGVRVPYRRAGAAQRAASLRANKAPGLRLADRRVLDAVFAFTTTYSKLADKVSVAQLVEATSLSDRQVRRSLTRLREADVITHVPGRGRGRLTVVGVPKADAKEDTFSTAFAEEKAAVSEATFAPYENRPGDAPESGHGHPAKGDERARAVSSEKCSEKKPSPRTTTDFPEDLERLLRGFDLRRSQRAEVLAGYRENPDGLARCVQEAINGHTPEGLLTDMVREGRHRQPGADTVEEVIHLLDLIDRYYPPPTPEADASPEPEPVETFWGGMTPDEVADHIYETCGDIFKRPERARP